MSTVMETRFDVDGAPLSQRAVAAMARYQDMREQSAKLGKDAPDPPALLVVVRVPRKALPSLNETPWADLKAMAKAGERGLSLYAVVGIERAPQDEAWLEDCRSTGMLTGRACLYSQGW